MVVYQRLRSIPCHSFPGNRKTLRFFTPRKGFLFKHLALSCYFVSMKQGAFTFAASQMGKRREPRKQVNLPVRIFGTDASGQIFSENVVTEDISREGARLSGVKSSLKSGEIVGLSYGPNKGRFYIKWIGEPGTPRQGQIGLGSVGAANKSLWDVPLPEARIDNFVAGNPIIERFSRPLSSGRPRFSGMERRQHPRMKCMTSVQLIPDDQAPIWGNALDLSIGGCFVEMAIPLKVDTKLKIGIWIQETKLWASGSVVNSRPGFGVGIRFSSMSDADAIKLVDYLRSITQTPP